MGLEPLKSSSKALIILSSLQFCMAFRRVNGERKKRRRSCFSLPSAFCLQWLWTSVTDWTTSVKIWWGVFGKRGDPLALTQNMCSISDSGSMSTTYVVFWTTTKQQALHSSCMYRLWPPSPAVMGCRRGMGLKKDFHSTREELSQLGTLGNSKKDTWVNVLQERHKILHSAGNWNSIPIWKRTSFTPSQKKEMRFLV